MNNITKSEKTNIELLLALTHKTVTKGVCLSDELMASLIDNRLNELERQKVMEHLNTCESCFDTWIHLSDDNDLPESSLSLKYYALAASFILFCFIGYSFMNYLKSPDMDQLIKQSYQIAILHNVSYKHDVIIARLESKKPSIDTLSFMTSDKKNQPINQMIFNGLIMGIKCLKQKNVNVQINNSYYHNLGMFCVILRIACLNDLKDLDFWNKQRLIAQLFYDKSGQHIDNNSASIIDPCMDTFKKYLHVPLENINCKALVDEIRDNILPITSNY